jgi:hypothetical protein
MVTFDHLKDAFRRTLQNLPVTSAMPSVPRLWQSGPIGM